MVSSFTPEVQAFLNRAEHALGELPPPTDVYAFGDSPALADSLLGLVLAGTKTATCNWPTDVTYREGDLSVVLDGAGRPRALLKTVELREVPFLEVDAAFARDEGEGDRSLASWRDGHLRYFARARNAPRPFTEREAVLCERFEVLYTDQLDAPGSGS